VARGDESPPISIGWVERDLNLTLELRHGVAALASKGEG